MSASTTTSNAAAPGTPGWRDWQSHPERLELVLLAAFVALLVLAAALLQPAFLAPGNLRDVLVQAAPLCLVVLGQTLVIIVRGLDLSMASVCASVAVMATAFNTTSDSMVPVIVCAGLALGAAVGAFNAWLVVRRGISPFLATLAVMIVLQGARFAYTGGAPSGTLPEGMAALSSGVVAGLPVSTWIVLLAAGGCALFLTRSVAGRETLLVGSNPEAARLIGLPVARRIALAYVLSGMLAAAAGLVLVGYVGIVDNWTGKGLELDAIAAAVLGGAALSGGKGSVAGSILGALLLVMVFNIMVMLGLPVEAQMVVQGVVIIAAAATYAVRQSR
jgi:ribose/xylose/arabinose/galactoside ABC-type transport system permease subunit